MVIDDDIIDKCVTVKVDMTNGVPTPKYVVKGWARIARVLGKSESTVRARKDDPVPVKQEKGKRGTVWIELNELLEWADDRGLR